MDVTGMDKNHTANNSGSEPEKNTLLHGGDEVVFSSDVHIPVEEKPIIRTQDFDTPEEIYDKLIERIRKYHPSDDITIIEKAYRVAREAHKEQRRKSGEPYIIHPLCVALILADLELDKESIAGGLLHDVIEDTDVTYDDLKEEFGPEIALIVDGVTKLGRLSYSSDKIELQAENLKKMFLAMAKDIRVILIKLADRLHNMRTLQYMTPEKQKEKARETMDIYSPIAQRLGISKIKTELDDLSLQYLEPVVYQNLSRQVSEKLSERQDFVKNICAQVSRKMKEGGIECQVNGRVKHLFSIYKKMVNQNKTLDEIYDLFAIRIIVNSIRDCYAALGLIHEMYTPVPGRFKDYIALPKQNMYQSLHNTLIGPGGQPFEIQIRTYEMHKIAEYGIAAHWKYKENPGSKNIENQEEAKLTWLRQILEWQRDFSDNREFMNLIKDDLNLFSDSVYCFTPQGDVKSLPAGSTPIDFAYSIHSAVGNKMVGARVNGKLVNIDYKLQNGDRVEILTSANSRGPSRDWLNIVKSPQARTKINQWFRSQFKEENIVRGKELLSAYCKNKGIPFNELLTPKYMDKVIHKYGLKDWDSVCAAVGHGGLKEGQVINKMLDEYKKDRISQITDEDVLAQLDPNSRPKQQDGTVSRSASKNHHKGNGIIVKGIDDVAVRFSKCCNPLPGDEIVGYVTRGRGISIHRTDCQNMLNLSEAERSRLIDAEWEDDASEVNGSFDAEINIYVKDGVGVLTKIAQVFTENGVNVIALSSRSGKNHTATISCTFEVKNKEELNNIISKLRTVDVVNDITRTRG